MVSIGESLSELERMHRLRESVTGLFRKAVESAADYLVELEPQVTEPHRQAIALVATEVTAEAPPEVLSEACSAFRYHLREYRDRAGEYLSGLRKELAAKAANLQQICETLADGSDDHEARIGRNLKTLRETAARPEAVPVRAVLVETANAIDEGMHDFRQQHQATVAQFLVEIQMLHQRVQSLESDRQRERSTLPISRDEMTAQIGDALGGGEPHVLLLLRLRNLPLLRRQHGTALEDPLLGAFGKRLRQMVGAEAVISRWAGDQFVVLIAGNQTRLLPLGKRVAEHVGGIYVCSLDGKLVRPVLQVDMAMIECSSGDTAERVVQKLTAFCRLP
jgi:GGDEF domain-containing protein